MQTSFGVEFSQKSQDFTQGEKLAKVCLCLHSVFTWTFDGNFQESMLLWLEFQSQKFTKFSQEYLGFWT